MDLTLQDGGANDTCVSSVSTQFLSEDDDGKNKKALGDTFENDTFFFFDCQVTPLSLSRPLPCRANRQRGRQSAQPEPVR